MCLSGTSPHVVSSVIVTTEMNQANVSWVPGFDGGYTQKFTVWSVARRTIITLKGCSSCVWTQHQLFFTRFKQSSRGKHEWASLPVPTSKNYLLVTGLLAGTGYQFSVLPQNKLGSGPFSEIVSVRTQGLYQWSFMVSHLSPSLAAAQYIWRRKHVFLSCANRETCICHHSASPGPSFLPDSQSNRWGLSFAVAASGGSVFSADRFHTAGTQRSGPVVHPQQRH